jgi:hypothetical protein
MRVAKLKEEDLYWLREQPRQKHLAEILDDRQVKVCAAAEYSYTVFSEDGRVMMCGGLVPYWNGRAGAWATFNKDCRREFIGIHRVVERFFKIAPFRRIEAPVDVDFEPGHRWVKALGFTLEAPLMKKFLPNGVDCSLYARVQ